MSFLWWGNDDEEEMEDYYGFDVTDLTNPKDIKASSLPAAKALLGWFYPDTLWVIAQKKDDADD